MRIDSVGWYFFFFFFFFFFLHKSILHKNILKDIIINRIKIKGMIMHMLQYAMTNINIHVQI